VRVRRHTTISNAAFPVGHVNHNHAAYRKAMAFGKAYGSSRD
jgi:hypothetical protein